MDRKIKLSSAIVATVLGSTVATASNEVKKNVIFIITDDMRLDMASYGGGAASTPNLDALKAESVDFVNAQTTTGLSSPSRAALFTGRLGHRTGLTDNLNLWHCQEITLDKKHSTIIEWAKEAGYNIGYVGKWHVGVVTPADRGADKYYGNENVKANKKPKRPSFEKVKDYYRTDTTWTEKKDYYSTLDIPYEKSEAKTIVNNATRFLKENKNDERPLFLTVSFHTPHPSYKVPSPWNKMYDYKDVKLPVSLKNRQEGIEFQHDILWPWMDIGHMSDDDWRKTISYSMGLMTMFDQALGELFDTLKANGLWDDSMIIFTSDQGSMLAEHNLYDKGPYAYEGLMNIPMLVKAKNVKPKEVVRQVSLIDLNATMAEYMGLEPIHDNLDSRSLLPLINNGDKAWANIPDEVFYRYEQYNGRWFGVRAIRTPQFKYSFNPLGSDQLYDLKNDPDEMINLIDDKGYKAIIDNLQDRLLNHLKECEDTKAYEMMMLYTGRREY